MDGSCRIESTPVVLVVHCVDTEGPIGGDVRRNPDGTKEFYDNWDDIKASLGKITTNKYRDENCDSYGNPFMLNWFIMDFMGFETNPKNRIQEYNDTYDNIKSINTSLDSFHWHYHQPPKLGVGDQWSDDWENSNEHYNILGHRLLDREDFPEVFRAGGTIEDNKCSHWLENNLMIDYSNRSSSRSYETDNIFNFNWFGAPRTWGYYHPDREDFTRQGNMRRFIIRCVDAKSRLYELSDNDIAEAFQAAIDKNSPVILSYFSHDHRDMVDETQHVIKLIRENSKKFDVPFVWCDAKDALKISHNIVTIENHIGIERQKDRLMIYFRHQIYQKYPFVYTEDQDGTIRYHMLNLEWVGECPYYLQRCFLDIDAEMKKVGIACTSLSGDKCIKVEEI